MQIITSDENQILFAQISKVDVEKRLVYGRATDETPDRTDEIFDYATSKEHFQKWSSEAAAATGGASVGNLRAMHGKVAAGKLTEIDFNDSDRAIDVVAKVTDNNEWEKVLDGTYTGFSIGGGYLKKWKDPLNKSENGKPRTRYTAKPTELSLVDRPCNSSSKFFEIRKADGSTEQMAFKQSGGDESQLSKEDSSMKNRAEQESALTKHDAANTAEALGKLSDEDVAKLHSEAFPEVVEKADDASGDEVVEKSDEPIEVAGSNEEVFEFAKYLNDNELSMGDVLSIVKKSAEPEAVVTLDETPMAKGMYTVGRLAELVQSLNYIMESTKAEEKQENDGSDLGARLTSAVSVVGGILVDMAAEEVSELVGEDEEPNEAATAVMALYDDAGELVKIADEKFDILMKAGGKSTTMEHIQKVHDHAKELGASCASEKADAVIDAPVEKLDAPATDSLQKLHDENAELRKSQDALLERITKMEGALVPSKIVLRAVAKSEDSGALNKEAMDDGIKPVMKSDGTVDEVATAIKKSQQSGGVPLKKW